MKMKNFKFGLIAVLVAAISIFSLACPSQRTTSTSATTSTGSTTATITTSGTVTTSTSSFGTGNLNLYNIDPFTLDPATASEATSQGYIQQIYSGLVTLDDKLNPVPDIAASWKIDTTGKVYTFTLRKDVQFHFGRQVTAGDFKYAWERACNPQTGSQTALTYLGDIVGASEMLAGTATSLSGVRVIDDYTLEVTITASHPYFLYKLGYSTAFVVDKYNVDQGANWWQTPNGTGPFKLKSWTAK
jgi:oligopeptide transport system substrate-binding protein